MIAGLFIEPPVDKETPDPESQVGGLFIQFKDGVSESEVKSILQNYNMTRTIEWNMILIIRMKDIT